jgi:predicted dehydrogenase
MSLLTRRSFLHASSAVVGLPAVNVVGANDTINIACIGSGGRCRHLMQSLVKIKGVRITGVCDVWDVALAEGKKLASPQALVTKDYKEVLAQKDVHAVLIGTPDHWHVPLTIEAVQAGKDVFVEKPLTHEMSEGKKVLDAVKKSKQVVQVGTQQRSMPHIQKAKELMAAGRLGTISRVRLSWNRNTDRVKRFKLGVDPKSVDWKSFVGTAPKQPFDEYRFRNWRWFWDFGGGIFTDLMVHWIDVAHWFLGTGMPLQAVSIGSHHNSKGVWETADTVQTLLTYPGDVQVHFEGTFSNAHMGARIEFLGTNASMYIDRGRYELMPERGRGKPDAMILGPEPQRGRDFYTKPDGELLHLTNWVESMRTRRAPSAPVEAGVRAAAAAHLANQALCSGMPARAKPEPRRSLHD